MASFILSETRGAVAIITLNRPEVLNAWQSPMRDLLVAALDAAEGNEAVHAIIMTGAGDRARTIAGEEQGEVCVESQREAVKQHRQVQHLNGHFTACRPRSAAKGDLPVVLTEHDPRAVCGGHQAPPRSRGSAPSALLGADAWWL